MTLHPMRTICVAILHLIETEMFLTCVNLNSPGSTTPEVHTDDDVKK